MATSHPPPGVAHSRTAEHGLSSARATDMVMLAAHARERRAQRDARAHAQDERARARRRHARATHARAPKARAGTRVGTGTHKQFTHARTAHTRA
eukprot:5855873-Pleurochrysis_carterae.AAC.1